MAESSDRLSVRQHDRFECRVAARLGVDPGHTAQVSFSRSVAESRGQIPATVVDVSRGGLGVETLVYLPKGCRLALHVTAPGQSQAQTVQVRVQRVRTVGREPRYYVGTSFVDPSAGAGLVESLGASGNRRAAG